MRAARGAVWRGGLTDIEHHPGAGGRPGGGGGGARGAQWGRGRAVRFATEARPAAARARARRQAERQPESPPGRPFRAPLPAHFAEKGQNVVARVPMGPASPRALPAPSITWRA
jgi:hypothetical protein